LGEADKGFGVGKLSKKRGGSLSRAGGLEGLEGEQGDSSTNGRMKISGKIHHNVGPAQIAQETD